MVRSSNCLRYIRIVGEVKNNRLLSGLNRFVHLFVQADDKSFVKMMDQVQDN